MQEVGCSLISTKLMWRQAGRMHAGCALEHTVMSGLSGIHTHRVHLEKPGMFSVSEVKDRTYRMMSVIPLRNVSMAA